MKRLSVFFLLIGITGAVLFFPFNMNNRYTCLYHRLFCGTDPVITGHGSFVEQQPLHHATVPYRTIHDPQSNALIPHYLKHFAVYWWASLLLAGICLWWFRKKNSPSLISEVSDITRNPSRADKNIITG